MHINVQTGSGSSASVGLLGSAVFLALLLPFLLAYAAVWVLVQIVLLIVRVVQNCRSGVR